MRGSSHRSLVKCHPRGDSVFKCHHRGDGLLTVTSWARAQRCADEMIGNTEPVPTKW